jgi:hypothetical protein
MSKVRKWVSRAVAVAAAAGFAVVAQTGTANAQAAPYTCHGGTVPSGTYSTLTVTGTCFVDGDVYVNGDVTVTSNAALIQEDYSYLWVGGSIGAGSGAVLELGCEDFTCSAYIAHDLVASGANAVIVHDSYIGGSANQTGGGGGTQCPVFEAGIQPAIADGPGFSTYSDTTIRGNLTITGVRTCWMGLTRIWVGGSVTYTGNVTGDPDGNEIVSNYIKRNLACVGNRPAPQVGDSGGSLNQVNGIASGQCADLVGGVVSSAGRR